MNLVKGKVKFIRSLLGCFIWPLVMGYFYSYLKPDWFYVNQGIGIALVIAFTLRGFFEVKMAKNINNAKLSFFTSGIFLIYIIIRWLKVM